MTIVCMECGKDVDLLIKRPTDVQRHEFWGVHCDVEYTLIVKPAAESQESK